MFNVNVNIKERFEFDDIGPRGVRELEAFPEPFDYDEYIAESKKSKPSELLIALLNRVK